MKVIKLDAAARDAFLADRRLGILATLTDVGAPLAVPLWYGWDGRVVEMFSERKAPKLARLVHDPRASVLVTNIPPEPARWVSLEGRVAVREGGYEAALRLLARYLPSLSATARARVLAQFEQADLVRLELVPDRIRTYAEIF